MELPGTAAPVARARSVDALDAVKPVADAAVKIEEA
jgi:hypothetical protein